MLIVYIINDEYEFDIVEFVFICLTSGENLNLDTFVHDLLKEILNPIITFVLNLLANTIMIFIKKIDSHFSGCSEFFT